MCISKKYQMKIAYYKKNKKPIITYCLLITFAFSFFIAGCILSSNPIYYTPSTEYHIVQKNEDLSNISRKYNISKENLKLYNNLKSDRIFAGQKIHLFPRAIRKSEFVTVRSIPESKIHTVRKNESIHRIAKMYNQEVMQILEFNDLKTFKLHFGQKLWLESGHNVFVSKEIEKKIEKKPPTKEKVKEKTPDIRKDIWVKFYKKGELIVPVQGIVTSEYGNRNGMVHKGIDIAASIGEPVYAVLNGTVAFAGTQRGYGNVIIIEHKGYVMTIYAHNETNLVRLGEKVKQGQPIATIGETGTTSGPHLHFEYRVKGKAINPRDVLPNL